MMIRYGKCLNIDDDCPKAKSGEVIIVEGAKELVCPDCGSELFEVPKPPSGIIIEWRKVALVAGALLLLGGIGWAFWPSPKALLKVEVLTLDCQTGILSLTATGGDGNAITYGVDGLKSGQESNKFIIPDSMRNDKLLLIYATQNDTRADTSFAANCTPTSSTTTVVKEDDTNVEVLHEGDHKSDESKPSRPITWTRVPGSEFCEDLIRCVQVYTERNNLGQTRERRIQNCKECEEAKK